MRHLKLTFILLAIPAVLLSCDSAKDDGAPGAVPTENRMPGLGEAAPAVAFEAADSDLTGLIPAEASMLLYVPSPEELFAKVREIVGMVDPDEAKTIQIDEAIGGMLEEFRAGSLTTEMLDLSRPMAMAGIIMEGRYGPEPMPVMILPVKDAEKADAAVDGGERGPSHAAAGGYLAFCPAPGVQLGGGAGKLGGNMPAGDVVVRLDLASLIDTFGGEIDGSIQAMRADGLDQIPGMEGIGKTIQTFADKLMASAEGLDLSASFDDGTMDLHCFFTAKEGSALASSPAPSGDLMNLAGCLPAEFPVSVLVNADMSALAEWVKPMMDAMPPNSSEPFAKFMEKAMGMSEGLGDVFALAMDFGEGGMKMVQAYTAEDATTHLAEVDDMMSTDLSTALTDMGMEFVIGEKTQLAGHEVHCWTLVIDAAKFIANQPGAGDVPPEQVEMMQDMFDRMLGEGGLKVRSTAVGNRIVTAVGGSDAILEKAIAAAGATDVGPSGSLNDAVNRIGATPKLLVHMDIRKLGDQILTMVREMAPPRARDEVPQMPAGGAIPLTMYYTGDGRRYAMGTSLNLTRLMEMVKQFEEMK